MKAEAKGITIGTQALERMMPMHVHLDGAGRIMGLGPTLRKICASGDPVGIPFFDVFEIRRPQIADETVENLRALAGIRLRLSLRRHRTLALKGLLVPLEDGGEMLLNLSFGISLVEAVQAFGLSNSDFAPTDLAVEMLYLIEAKDAVMEESRRLNERLQSARNEAEERALTDTLTGLRNRRAMDLMLARLMDAGRPFGLMHVDLDYFKSVNDTFGHAAGDRVLQEAARILKSEVRAGDMVARVGGDEFVLVFDGLTDRDQLLSIAGRIVRRLEEPVEHEGNQCRISGSIGITVSDLYDEPDLDRMLSDVDAALYESKRQGRARSTMVSPDLAAMKAEPLARPGEDPPPPERRARQG